MVSNPNLLSPSTLAFLGDAVYGLEVRKRLCQVNRPSGVLHSMSVKLVNANAQAQAFKLIEGMLNDEEIQAFKKGRNMHLSSIPKSSTVGEYHTATGLETLFGFLFLNQNSQRIDELFSVIWENFSGNNN